MIGLKQLNDERLAALLREGKVDAFEEIYRRYWRKLLSIAYHSTGNQQEAEEIVQEVFLALWSRRDYVSIRNLDLYLTIAIKNQVYDFFKSKFSFRKYQEYLVFSEISQNHTTDEIVGYQELMVAVEKVLSRLPEKSAEIFKRSRFEKQSVRDIAKGMNLSEKAVEYHITKSVKFLRENLRAYHSEN